VNNKDSVVRLAIKPASVVFLPLMVVFTHFKNSMVIFFFHPSSVVQMF
jgi:hypothetical protein